MNILEGKTALITGGSRGIGKGIAEVFAQKGAEVIILATSDSVFETQKKFKDNGLFVEAIKCDVTDEAKVNENVSKILAKFHKIDILVNNAGVSKHRLFCETDNLMRDLHIDVNIKGTWNVTKAIIDNMIERNYGKIINMSSVSGPMVADPGVVAYGMTKAALIGFTKTLAVEVAKFNITVNAICPGYILTPNVLRSAQTVDPDNPEAILEKLANGIPMKKLGTPHQIAYLAAFLASDEADYITGTSTIIDGGNMIPETSAMGL